MYVAWYVINKVNKFIIVQVDENIYFLYANKKEVYTCFIIFGCCYSDLGVKLCRTQIGLYEKC